MNLKELLAKHRAEIDALRASCSHTKLIKYEDSSCVGAGSAFPSVRIVCVNCGKRKTIFRNREYKGDKVVYDDSKVKIKLRLS